MARKSSFSDAFSQSFSASVDRFNRKRDQIEEEKRAEARRKDEIDTERLYREDQKFLDREYEKEILGENRKYVEKQNVVAEARISDRMSRQNQERIGEDLVNQLTAAGIDATSFYRPDNTMYNEAARLELMDAKKQSEAGAAAGYADSFVSVPTGGPDDRFFAAMDRSTNARQQLATQAKDASARSEASTREADRVAKELELAPFIKQASATFGGVTGNMPPEVAVGTPDEGRGWKEYFNTKKSEDDLRSSLKIKSQAEQDEAIYKGVWEAASGKNVPQHLVGGLLSDDPEVKSASFNTIKSRMRPVSVPVIDAMGQPTGKTFTRFEYVEEAQIKPRPATPNFPAIPPAGTPPSSYLPKDSINPPKANTELAMLRQQLQIPGSFTQPPAPYASKYLIPFDKWEKERESLAAAKSIRDEAEIGEIRKLSFPKSVAEESFERQVKDSDMLDAFMKKIRDRKIREAIRPIPIK